MRKKIEKEKKTKLVIAALLILTFLFALGTTGCESETVDPVKVVNEVIEEKQSGINQLNELFGDSFTIELENRDGTLAYKYTLTASGDTAEAKVSQIEEDVEKNSETYVAILTAFKEKGYSNGKVIVEYYDAEGKQLFSRIFQP